MELTNLFQLVFRSIGIAIGVIFSLYFTFKALTCLVTSSSSLIAVACLSVIIAVVTLIKKRIMHRN